MPKGIEHALDDGRHGLRRPLHHAFARVQREASGAQALRALPERPDRLVFGTIGFLGSAALGGTTGLLGRRTPTKKYPYQGG